MNSTKHFCFTNTIFKDEIAVKLLLQSVSSSSSSLGMDLLPPINFDNGATIKSWLCFKTSDDVFVFLIKYNFWYLNNYDNSKEDVVGVVYDKYSSRPYTLFSYSGQRVSTLNIDTEL